MNVSLQLLKSRASQPGWFLGKIVVEVNGRDVVIRKKALVQRRSGDVVRYVGRVDASDRLVGSIRYSENFLLNWIFLVLVIGGIIASQGLGPDAFVTLAAVVSITGIVQLVRYLFARSEAQEILAFIHFDESRPGSAPRPTGAFSPVRLAVSCLGALLIYFAFPLCAKVA